MKFDANITEQEAEPAKLKVESAGEACRLLELITGFAKTNCYFKEKFIYVSRKAGKCIQDMIGYKEIIF